MHARMLPSKPKAWPLWTTKSLKYGFSPLDVQRSSTRPAAGAVRDREPAHAHAAHRIAAADEHVAVRASAPAARWACLARRTPRARVPSAGATLVAPAPLSSTICRRRRSSPDAASCSSAAAASGRTSAACRSRARRRPACRTAATITRSSTTSGELEKPHIGTFVPVSDAAFRDQMTAPVLGVERIEDSGRAERVDAAVVRVGVAARTRAAIGLPEADRVAVPPHRLAGAHA